MAIEYKDYYETLGLPRTATQEDIRKAFRQLAREYHPDVAKNKATGEERFKEINEAYEVLSDPDQRRKYDALGAQWKSGAEFRPPPGWDAGRTWSAPGGGAGGFEFHFSGTGFSDFFEQLFGATRRGRDAAGGGRSSPGADFSQRGEDVEADILVTLEEALNGSVRPISLRRNGPCRECEGTGRRRQQICPACAGAGTVTRQETYQVKIPPGVNDGQRLRLAGRGEAGTGRGGAGDLYLRVRLAKHPDFRQTDGHLYYELNVAPWEAVLGAKLSIPTLQGRVSIKLPAGSQNGHHLRLRGRGLPQRGGGRGDLFVVVNVHLPTDLGDRERVLWQQLCRESSFDPRH